MAAQRSDEGDAEDGEDQRLHDGHNQFQKIERNRGQSEEPGRSHSKHEREDILAAVNISIKPHGQRHRPDEDGNHLDQSDEEEDHKHRDYYGSLHPALDPEDMLNQTE